MLGLGLSAAILGIIIATMQEDAFPGWIPMGACVAVASLPLIVLRVAMPEASPALHLAGLIVSALLVTVTISALCEMSVKRAAIAAGIWFGLQIGLSVLIAMIF